MRTVIYTGTFDPFHRGHAWVLQATHGVWPFDQAVIAPHMDPAHKPGATSYKHRAAMISLATANLPFSVDVRPGPYGAFQTFLDELHLEGKIARILGSDSVIRLLTEPEWRPLLPLLHHLIVIRPLASQEAVEQAITQLPDALRSRFSYEIIATQTESLEARHMRQDIGSSVSTIDPKVYEYIRSQGLYSSTRP